MPLSSIKSILKLRCSQCYQLLANAQIKSGRQFCSRDCKNESQKKRLTLTCKGCHKVFSIHPYLKRQTNYCSVECYHSSTRVKEKRLCRVCWKEFYATGPLIKKGFGIYCSRECQKCHTQKPKSFYNLQTVWETKRGFTCYCQKKSFVL